ncbi:MAG: hypothetical protein JRF25_14505 [Deltaproteobacteria bacterium]|nr:hypothetical protein [Deltaproteobacteria bacterium]
MKLKLTKLHRTRVGDLLAEALGMAVLADIAGIKQVLLNGGILPPFNKNGVWK